MSHSQKNKDTITVKDYIETQKLTVEAMLSLMTAQDSISSLLSDLVDALSRGKVPEDHINIAVDLAHTVHQASYALRSQIRLGASLE